MHDDANINTGAPLLTESEAAKYLGVTPHALAVWRSTGRYDLPFVKVGRCIRYRRRDLDAWIDKRTQRAEHLP